MLKILFRISYNSKKKNSLRKKNELRIDPIFILQNLNEKTVCAGGLSWSLFLVLPLASWLTQGMKRQNALTKFYTCKTGIIMLFCFLSGSEMCGWKELYKNCYLFLLPKPGETSFLTEWCLILEVYVQYPGSNWRGASSAESCGLHSVVHNCLYFGFQWWKWW